MDNSSGRRLCAVRHFSSVVLLISAFVFSSGYAQVFGDLGGGCWTPYGRHGTCEALSSCIQYRLMLKQRPLLPNTVIFLRRAQCGFQGSHPLVCCPPAASKLGPGRAPPFLTGGDTTSNVVSGGGANVVDGKDPSRHPNWRLLSNENCGADVMSRIFGGQEAQLKEYPWLALLEYQTRRGRKFLCGGALISERYVLTAAHCVVDIGSNRLVGVRLGEHNIDTDPDCEEIDEDAQCDNQLQNIRVAEVTPHPQYRSKEVGMHNDIALIRLERPAQFTEFVVPICLPNAAAIDKRYVGESMFVAGWGKTENSSTSRVKMWVSIPVMSNEQCAPIYRRQFTLQSSQMCAGGEKGKDSCSGDSGGPLMFVDSVVPSRPGGQWVVVGIVSVGPIICASDGRPGIYTRVGPYVNWILDSIRP